MRPLITYLNDEQTLVQFAAARALGAIGDDRAVTPLREVATDSSKSAGVRRAAAESLVLLGYGVRTEPTGSRPLVFWGLGLALLGAGVALAATIGSFAVIPFLAGLGFLGVYYVKEQRAARRGGYSVDDGVDVIVLDLGGDHGGANGDGGNGGG